MLQFESAKKVREQSADASVVLQRIGTEIDAVRAEMRLPAKSPERRRQLQQEYDVLRIQWDDGCSKYLAAQSRLIEYPD